GFAPWTLEGQGRGAAPAPPPGSFAPWTPRDVLIWPDTFTNAFQPGIGRAAVEVLEDAGFQVRLPRAGLCCGRPLYDFGMLGLARGGLGGVPPFLGPAVRGGGPGA